MATELNRDEYGVIRHYQEEAILELEWLEASANMTDDDFKRSMQRYAELAGEHSTPYLLVDVTKFRHSMGEGVGAWRDKHIIPAYNAAGWRASPFLSRPARLARSRRGTPQRRSRRASFRPGTSQTAEASSSGFASST